MFRHRRPVSVEVAEGNIFRIFLVGLFSFSSASLPFENTIVQLEAKCAKKRGTRVGLENVDHRYLLKPQS